MIYHCQIITLILGWCLNFYTNYRLVMLYRLYIINHRWLLTERRYIGYQSTESRERKIILWKKKENWKYSHQFLPRIPLHHHSDMSFILTHLSPPESDFAYYVIQDFLYVLDFKWSRNNSSGLLKNMLYVINRHNILKVFVCLLNHFLVE